MLDVRAIREDPDLFRRANVAGAGVAGIGGAAGLPAPVAQGLGGATSAVVKPVLGGKDINPFAVGAGAIGGAVQGAR